MTEFSRRIVDAPQFQSSQVRAQGRGRIVLLQTYQEGGPKDAWGPMSAKGGG